MNYRTSLLGLLVVLLLAGPAWAGEIDVTSPYPAAVYSRPSGRGDFTLAASSTPAHLHIEAGGLYDIRLLARVSFFYIARGEQPKVPDGASVQIPMTVELDLLRLGLFGILLASAVGGLLGAWLTRRRRMVDQFELVQMTQTSRTRSTTTELPTGHAIGKYTIVAPIARGGMGAVYEVEDAYGDRYAMKIPDGRALDDPESRARFEREAQIGKDLHHPHIVRMYDANLGEDGPDPYIVLEMVRGCSLREVMRQEPVMSLERAAGFIRPILMALEYGHQRGVVHRDVKPSNILIGENVCKVSDWGIARMLNSGGLTSTHAAIGTPLYMAPEQIRTRNADARADIYSTAVILFEMLTGRLPFDADESNLVMMQKMALDPPRASEANPALSSQVDHILQRAMARQPDHRYASAQEFLNNLNHLLGDSGSGSPKRW